MKQRVILDTGPLVALLNGKDKYHRWVTMQFARIKPPLLTCEAVLSEACFLLSAPASDLGICSIILLGGPVVFILDA